MIQFNVNLSSSFVHTFDTWESSIPSFTFRTKHSLLTFYTWNQKPLNLPSLSSIALYKYEGWHTGQINCTSTFCQVKFNLKSYQGNQEHPVVPSHPLVHYNQAIQAHPTEHDFIKVYP